MKQSQNHQQPVVTQHKSNIQKQHAPSTATSAHVTNISVSNFPHNVLPTATLDVSYCHAKTFTRAFFDTGSQSFVSPELVRKLNLPVIEQVPVHLSTFGNDTTMHFLNLVKIKVQVGRRRIPVKLLVHDSASMGYLNCPGIHTVVKMLELQGHKLADRNITSDSLTGIELLISVDYFAQFITRQKRANGISLFVTGGGGGVIPFGTMPKWTLNNESTAYTGHYTCVRIICESKSERDRFSVALYATEERSREDEKLYAGQNRGGIKNEKKRSELDGKQQCKIRPQDQAAHSIWSLCE